MNNSQIKWSEYIPAGRVPTPKQIQALSSNARELLFGGALGGGKSDLLLMAALQYMDIPGYASAVFRRQLSDLKQPGALLDRARSWLAPHMGRGGKVKYIPSEHTFYFSTRNYDGTVGTPARMCFCYSGDANAVDRYQSAEYQTVCFDELSHWERSTEYELLLTRLRKNVCSIHQKYESGPRVGEARYHPDCPECKLKKMSPTRMLSASNPGGVGGTWLMNYFQITPDPKLYPDKRDAILAIMEGKKVPYVSSHPYRVFIPSFIDDNPHLDQAEYDLFLNNLDPNLRSALRDGNWLARVDTRFNRRNIKYYNLYSDCLQIGTKMFPFSFFKKVFMTVDPAGTVREGVIDQKVTNNSHSYTVISVWGIDENNNLYFLDMNRFTDEIPEVVREITEMYVKWKKHFPNIFASMEVNGVGLGASQYVKRLGVPVKSIKKQKDKLSNSTAAQLLMKAGKIYFPHNTDWISEAEDEIFGWTGLPSETDDIVDTLSDAAVEIGPIDDVLEDPNDPEVLDSFRDSLYSPTRYQVMETPIATLTSGRTKNPLTRFFK